jgi:hypothetical protein
LKITRFPETEKFAFRVSMNVSAFVNHPQPRDLLSQKPLLIDKAAAIFLNTYSHEHGCGPGLILRALSTRW